MCVFILCISKLTVASFAFCVFLMRLLSSSVLLLLMLISYAKSFNLRSWRVITLSMSSSSSSYDFYRSIGSPKFVSAPMVDQSELAWRLLVKRNGADLAFSQMMHARNFQTDPKYRRDCIDWRDYAHNGWNGSVGTKGLDAEGLDKNLIVQLAGDDPDVLVKAGRWIQNDKNVAAVDLNLGCPQKIAKRGHYGAYLLPEKELVTKL